VVTGSRIENASKLQDRASVLINQDRGPSPAAAFKINYPEDVVLRFGRSTGCRQISRSRGATRCSIC
jgi:hypothetical protein